MNEISKKRVRRTRSQIDQVVADFRASGLSKAGFCRQHRVRYASLHAWLKRAPVAPPLAEVKNPFQPWAVEIQFPNGTVVRLADGQVISDLLRSC